MIENNLVFVYGTLKAGEDNHHLMDELAAVYFGEARLAKNNYAIIDCMGLPYLVHTEAQASFVKGELYSVPSSSMNKLDKFERGYTRVTLPVYTTSGVEMNAFAYLYETPDSLITKYSKLCYNYTSQE